VSTSSEFGSPAPAPPAAAQSKYSGLSSGEAAARRARYGPNRVSRPRARPLRNRLREWLNQPLVLILLMVVGSVYAVLGQFRDAVAILAVVVVLISVELAIRWRAGRAISTLSQLSAPQAMVWRDRELQEMAPERLVVDDVILLVPGSKVPADARLLEAEKMLVDESLVSGEPQPVEHGVGTGQNRHLSAGTIVVRGRGVALVTAVGKDSTMGRVAALVDGAEPRSTPLQRQIGRLANGLLIAALVTSAVVAVVGAVRGQPLLDMTLSGLTLAIATIPAEMPILALVLLGAGSLRLAKKGAIVRTLRAAETLGSVTLVCTDKTGTLTENRIVLTSLLTAPQVLEGLESQAGDSDYVKRLARLASEPPAGDDPRSADPIDLAIWRESPADWPDPMARFSFDEGRRLASGLVEVGGQLLLGVKGAPEAIIVRSSCWRSSQGIEPLDEELRSQVIKVATSLAAGGARVLGIGSRSISGLVKGGPAWLEHDLAFEGLLVFSDVMRPEVPGAIRDLFRAGVAVSMITGDQPATAAAMARPAGLGGPVFIAAQTKRWSDQDLAARASIGSIFARARPEDKLRIVRAASGAGEIVAVTGDGVNDAPALEAAALGVAMGREGSDVAREASDLVLAGDNFAALVSAIAEGRRLYENVRKAIGFYLAIKLGLVVVALGILISGRPLPFSPLQIVLIEVFTDLGASIGFVNLASEADEMRRPPRDSGAPFVSRKMLRRALAGAITLSLLTAAVFVLALPMYGVGGARTLALSSWLVGHASLGLVMGWERRWIGVARVLENKAMALWVAGAVFLAGLLAVAGSLQALLHSGPVPIFALSGTVLASLLAPWWLEMLKRAQARRRARAQATTAPR
jgi:P-type Ca2+ transporter type 2C